VGVSWGYGGLGEEEEGVRGVQRSIFGGEAFVEGGEWDGLDGRGFCGEGGRVDCAWGGVFGLDFRPPRCYI